MKYFVYTFNYLTLLKTITYAENEWGTVNTHILYLASATAPPPPNGLSEGDYKTHIVCYNQYYKRPIISKLVYFAEVFAYKKIVNDFLNYIESQAPNKNENIKLVVFRDNQDIEVLLIKEVKRKYKNVEVILIEEGLALYASEYKRLMTLNESIKKSFLKLMGISPLSYSGLPHGCNPAIDKIICRYPEALYGKRQDRGNNITKEIDVFNAENSRHLMRDILKLEIEDDSYDFVFLSQPIFPRNNSLLNKKYDVFLKELFGITSQYGNLLIKPHPHDLWDYTPYEAEKVSVCNKTIAQCPFECLMGFYGNPQTITLYSSAGCNSPSNKPVIFLYEMFPEIIRKDVFSEQFIEDNNITKCKNFEEFQKAMNVT